MPLLPGEKNFGKNYKKMMSEGKSRQQALAIAMSMSKQMGRAKMPMDEKSMAKSMKKKMPMKGIRK